MILLACVWLPELNKLIPDEQTGWDVYHCAVEVTRAALCYLFVQNIFGRTAALWFLTQAIDEATGRNVWNYQQDWQEIALFTVLAVGAWAAWFWQRNR